MNSRAFLLCVLALRTACSSQDQSKNTLPLGRQSLPSGYRVEGDSLIVPPFAVEVRLDDKANRQLAAQKETVIVAAYLEGEPVPNSVSPANRTKDGRLRIAEARIALQTGRIARFSGIKFARQQYDQLADKDLNLLVNVFSGRRSTEDNLLDCRTIQEKLSAVAGQTSVVTGHLIRDEE